MNDSIHSDLAPEVPWPTSDYRMPVPDTSMLPGTELTPPAAVDTLQRAVKGTHDAVDRFADRAMPRVQQLSDSVADAGATLRANVDRLRGTVRRNPLLAFATALALGAAVVRLGGRTRPAARG